MQKAKIINFNDARDPFQVAFEWAISEQKRMGFVAQPVNFAFEKDEITYDENKVYVSVFYDEKSGHAILRRDWDEGFVVQYNVLANYDELARIAPNSLTKLKDNGVNLYKRYRRAGFGL